MKRATLIMSVLAILTLWLAACAPAAATPNAPVLPTAEPTATTAPTTPPAEPTAAEAAAAEPTAAPAAGGPITLADAIGYEITLEGPAQKIVSIAPSNTEIIFALGAEDQLIGRDLFSNYPAEAEEIFNVGGDMGAYNLEEIARLEPDLILASPLTAEEAIQGMKEITPNVFVLPNPTSLEEMYANLVVVGELTGKKAEAEAMAADLEQRAAAVLEKVKGATETPKVFYELDATDPAKPWTAGPGTFIDMLIGLAGGENIGAALSGEWAQISQEELIVQNPDVILLGDALYGGITAEQVAARPGWDTIKAVQDGRVLPFNDDLVSRPGPRLVDGLEELAKVLHPGLFE